MTIRFHKIIHCISSRDYVTILNHQAMMETAAKRAAAPATSWLEPSSSAGAAGAALSGSGLAFGSNYLKADWVILIYPSLLTKDGSPTHLSNHSVTCGIPFLNPASRTV